MINSEKIKEIYEAACGYTLYNDMGEVEKATRVKNEIEYPVCGLFKMQPITLTAIRAPFIGVASANVEIVAPTHMLEDVRTTLNTTVVAALNGKTETLPDEEDETKEYAISFNVQTCTVGEKVDAGVWYGECAVLYQTISFVIIEAGVSSYDAILKIDGCEVPILSLSETKVHTTSVYSSANAIGHTASEQEAFGIDFATPYLKNEMCELFREAVNGHTGNKAHCVEIIKNGVSSAYIMTFSAAADSVQPPSNVGFNISMTEVSETIAHFDGRWRRYTCEEDIITSTTLSDKLPQNSDFEEIIFWGDGSSERYSDAPYPYHVYTDGKKMHDVMIYTEYPLNAVRPIRIGDTLAGTKVHIFIGNSKLSAKNISDLIGSDLFIFSSNESDLICDGNRIYFSVDKKIIYVDESMEE